MVEQPKKDNKLLLIIALCTLVVIIFILLSSYAYWKISKHQNTTNYVNAGCLEIEFEEPDTIGFTLSDALPIDDFDGISREDNLYNFNVVNTCKKEVTYEVVLEYLEQNPRSLEMDSSYIKLQLDSSVIKRYSDLDPVDKDPDATYGIAETRSMFTGTIAAATDAGPAKVSHNVRIWMASDAGLDAREKVFDSRVKVYAGQGLPEPQYATTAEKCFVFDSNTNTITGYNRNIDGCNIKQVVFPATIGGEPVKVIASQLDNYFPYDYEYLDISNMTYLESIEDRAFWYYIGTNYSGTYNDLVMPENLKTIGDEAFNRFNGKSVVLNDNLIAIGNGAFNAFYGSGSRLVIPNSVTTIGVNAFYHFVGSDLVMSNSIETIGYGAFPSYRGSADSSLVLPDTLTVLEQSNFNSYQGKHLTLPSNITALPALAFAGYNGEDDIHLPSTITSIGNNAFREYCQGYNERTMYIDMTEAEYNANVTHPNNWCKNRIQFNSN